MLVVGYLKKWDRADLPGYRQQLRHFEAANKNLARHAGDKDSRPATRAYTRLVVSRAECHGVIRDAGRGK
jgi:hypothetical protein